MSEYEILKIILETVQQINPDIKSISSNDVLYGADSTWGLSSMEVAVLLVNIEDQFDLILNTDLRNIQTIVDCICERH